MFNHTQSALPVLTYSVQRSLGGATTSLVLCNYTNELTSYTTLKVLSMVVIRFLVVCIFHTVLSVQFITDTNNTM